MEFITLCDNFNVTWNFNGKPIVDHAVTSSVINYPHYNTSLKVAQSSERDTGTYTVIVSSTCCNVSVDISVNIIGELC